VNGYDFGKIGTVVFPSDTEELPKKGMFRLTKTTNEDLSASGFSGGMAGGLSELNGNFTLDWNATDDDWESTQLNNGVPAWTISYDTSNDTWYLDGTDGFANAVTYMLSGDFNPDGSNTFDFSSSSGGGTRPSTLTVDLAS
jgi:hypothetical protein